MEISIFICTLFMCKTGGKRPLPPILLKLWNTLLQGGRLPPCFIVMELQSIHVVLHLVNSNSCMVQRDAY